MKSLKETWSNFLKIRNERIVPEMDAGKTEDAKKAAADNKVNFDKVYVLLGCE